MTLDLVKGVGFCYLYLDEGERHRSLPQVERSGFSKAQAWWTPMAVRMQVSVYSSDIENIIFDSLCLSLNA